VRVVVGIGVEVSAAGLHAIALDERCEVVAERRVGGVSTSTELTGAIALAVSALGGREVPVAIAWDDGGTPPPADVGGGPVTVAAHIRRWAADGVRQIIVTTDENGGRWAVAQRPGRSSGEAVRRAAALAGVAVAGCEPVASARARHAGACPAETMAKLAAGRLAPSTCLDVLAPIARPEPRVWVLERQPDDPGVRTGDATLRRRRRSR